MIKLKQQTETQTIKVITREDDIVGLVVYNETTNQTVSITPSLIEHFTNYSEVSFEDTDSFLVEKDKYTITITNTNSDVIFYSKAYCEGDTTQELQEGLYTEYNTNITYKEYKG